MALSMPCAQGAVDEAPFYLKSGDCVVFYGDSITDQRLYTVFTETFVSTRFPELDVVFIHSGWGGDRVTGGRGGDIDTRLGRDVFPYRPTVMTIMLGMNDGRVRGNGNVFDQVLFDTFSRGYRSIVSKVRSACPDVRFTFIRPSPHDDITRPVKTPGRYNDVLIRYGEFVESLAVCEKETVADLNAPLVAVLKQAYAADRELAQKIIPDRVHPASAGHIIMAGSLLKAWGAPALVSEVVINAHDKRVIRKARTSVSDLVFGDNAITWTQCDQALPMPLEMNKPEFALAINCSDFMESLNRQMLRVEGLSEAGYQLSIDGKKVGVFTREELAQGINLAPLETPMLEQARRVHGLTLRRADLHNLRWRSLQTAYAEPRSEELRRAMPVILAALDAEVAAIATARRKAARPVARHYRLERVESHASQATASHGQKIVLTTRSILPSARPYALLKH